MTASQATGVRKRYSEKQAPRGVVDMRIRASEEPTIRFDTQKEAKMHYHGKVNNYLDKLTAEQAELIKYDGGVPETHKSRIADAHSRGSHHGTLMEVRDEGKIFFCLNCTGVAKRRWFSTWVQRPCPHSPNAEEGASAPSAVGSLQTGSTVRGRPARQAARLEGYWTGRGGPFVGCKQCQRLDLRKRGLPHYKGSLMHSTACKVELDIYDLAHPETADKVKDADEE
jgi:hypothetical protein